MKYLEHYTSRDILRAGDGCMSGVLFGLLFLLIALCFLIGCSTCPPCQPTIETVLVDVPVYSCPAPPALQPLLLQTYPDYPGSSATDQEIKDWFASVVSISRSRDLAHGHYVEYLLSIVESYRTP